VFFKDPWKICYYFRVELLFKILLILSQRIYEALYVHLAVMSCQIFTFRFLLCKYLFSTVTIR
jgi:hypothetical protein